MTREIGNMTMEVIEGIRITIKAPRDEQEELLKTREEIRKSLERFGGEIVDEESTFETSTLMIKFSNYASKQMWLSKMQFYSV